MHVSSLIHRFICVCGILFRANVCFGQLNSPVELTWEAPKECPQDPEVQQQLRQFAGKVPDEKTSSFQAHGIIQPVEDHYRLTLLIESGAKHGSRVIDSDDCRSLAKAAAIVLALLVQKERALGRELSEDEMSGRPDELQRPENPPAVVAPTPPPATLPPEEPPASPAPNPNEAPSTPWYFLLRAPEFKVDFATLPQPGYGIGLGGGIAYRAWRALVTGTFYLPESVTSPGPRLHDVEYHRQSLSAMGCYGWRSNWSTNAFEFAPCGIVTADRVSAHASGNHLVPHDKAALWVSIGAGFSGYLHLYRHWALVASLSGRITTNRAELLVGAPTGTERTYKVPLGVADLALAFEWSF
ncbi:MAG TPA: hypothetical protein VIV60_03985 [Polyangiaceae bacterium]